MGRLNKPQQLRKITGKKATTPPVDPKKLAKPKLAIQSPPPDDISVTAAQYWEKNCEMVIRIGIFSEADYDSFKMLCESYADWRHAEETWQGFLSTRPQHGGMMIAGVNGGWVANPQIAAKQKAKQDFLKLLMEYGMTPASRARVGVVEGFEAGKADQFDI